MSDKKYHQALTANRKLLEENARLKAEVERLTDCKAGADRLKAEVERLRKHGDAMAEALEAAGFNNARDFWNAAKEGKPTV